MKSGMAASEEGGAAGDRTAECVITKRLCFTCPVGGGATMGIGILISSLNGFLKHQE